MSDCSDGRCPSVVPYRERVTFFPQPLHFAAVGQSLGSHVVPNVRAHAADGAARSNNSQTRATAAHTGQDSDQDYEQDEDVPERPSDFESPSDDSMPKSVRSLEQWQGLHAYRLDQPMFHCFARWGTYNSILLDVVRFLRMRLRNVVLGFIV